MADFPTRGLCLGAFRPAAPDRVGVVDVDDPFVARCFRNERGELLRHLSLLHHFS